MTTLRACDGAVSSEQRSSTGSSALPSVRRAGAATTAIAEATKARRDKDCIISFSVFRCRAAGRGEAGEPVFAEDAVHSEDEADAGDDQQCVDDELELPVREAFEDAQSEPGAEQGGRNEGERLPVELRLHR